MKALFIGPAIAFFSLFLLLPVVAALCLAWTHWSGFDVSQISWAGSENIEKLGHDDVFGKALWHTLVFVVFTTLLLNVVGLTMAMLINTRVRGHEFARVAMFLPLGLSPVVTAVLWQYLLGPYGFVNGLLLGVFIYWGWDSGVAVNEESEDRADGPGKSAVVSTLLLLGI